MKKLPAFLFLFGLALPLWADKPKAPQSEPPAVANAGIDGESFRFSGGNAESGRQSFAALSCNQCHLVAGTEIPEPDKRRLDLEIGEEPRFVKSYEDIITAITNPKHVITKRYVGILSKADDTEPFMPKLTEHMTAQQLIDLVTFLDGVYAEQNEAYRQQQ